jgi:ABC-type Mn2+/Zn2+ transport system permease subunit
MNMETVMVVVSLVVLLIVGSVASFKGLDLRRRSSWLYGGISFLCGLALGISLSGNWVESLKVGAIIAFVTLFTGATMRRHKQKYNEDYARSLLLKYGKEDDSSLFAKLVRRLLSKYK